MANIKRHPKNGILYSKVLSLMAVICVVVLLSQAQQPVLKIARLGTNYFSVVITNGASTTNYTIFWTPALENSLYPWQVLTNGGTGETNFTVDGGEFSGLFFRAMIGNDFDGDGAPDWKDGQPFNTNVGVLSITIDSPANGASFN